VLDGDADRQIAAIWTYLAEGPRAKFPEGLSRSSKELVIGGETVVYRGKLWESGYRSVAIGYPERVNASFDAEEMRLALLWRGRFLDASAHWSIQGMGSIRPLGTQVAVFPHGPELAVLPDSRAPWPSEKGRLKGYAFGGYHLNEANQPTLKYSIQKIGVEDFLSGSEVAGQARVRRFLKFSGEALEGLHFRVAAGSLTPAGENTWRFANTLNIRVDGESPAQLRGTGEAQELIVPVRIKDGQAKLEIEYAW